MKDAEARARLDELQQSLTGLPDLINKTVMAELDPLITRFNDAITRFNEAAETLDEVDAKIEAVAKHVSSHGELLEILESDHNAVRVDVNAAINSAAAALEKVTGIVSDLQKIGQSA